LQIPGRMAPLTSPLGTPAPSSAPAQAPKVSATAAQQAASLGTPEPLGLGPLAQASPLSPAEAAPAATDPRGVARSARGTEVAVSTTVASSPAATTAAQAAEAAAPRPAELTERLRALLPDHPFVISAERAAQLQQQLKLNSDELLQALVPVAQAYARPSISNYQVGAAGRGASGAIYLGVNLEFPGNALNQTVHGEQFVVTNALAHGEEQLTELAVSAAPCGHCRQWLNETSHGADIRILTPQQPPRTIGQLLPAAFGPADLGVTSALLSKQDNQLHSARDLSDAPLVAAALQAANASYAPYSKDGSGVAVQLKDGSVYTGRYSENAAFNPSLSPLQGALIALVEDGKSYDQVETAVLVERAGAKASQQPATASLLASACPHASLQVETVA
jgi:cytidine deaminase